MKKIILVTISIPIILFISLIGFILIDMKYVEKTSEICLPLISKINEYKKQKNVYPEDISLITGDNTLKTICNYQLDSNKYIFALVGSAVNLQVYVYNSEQNTWYWD